MENKVRVDGFLQDFELRVFGNNSAVGSGSICFGGGKDKNGKPLKRSYVKFDIWNPKVELSDALTAGASQEDKKPVVRLMGRLKEDTWPDKTTGKTIRQLKVVAEDIIINPEGAFKTKTTAPQAPAQKTTVAKAPASKLPVAPTTRRPISPPPPPADQDPVDVPPPAEEEMPF